MCDISSSKFRKLLQDKLLAFSQKNTNKKTNKQKAAQPQRAKTQFTSTELPPQKKEKEAQQK
jgi:hypothetical protein